MYVYFHPFINDNIPTIKYSLFKRYAQWCDQLVINTFEKIRLFLTCTALDYIIIHYMYHFRVSKNGEGDINFEG